MLWAQNLIATATRRLQEVCRTSGVFTKYFAKPICLAGLFPAGSVKKEIFIERNIFLLTVQYISLIHIYVSADNTLILP